MVKTPKTHHSGRHREPTTIDLEAQAVRAADHAEEKSSGDSTDKPLADTAGSGPGSASEATARVAGSEDNAVPKDSRPAAASTSTSNFGRPQSAEKAAAAKAPAPEPKPAKRAGGGSMLAAGLVGGVIALAGAGLLQYAGMLPSPSRGVDTGQATEVAALRGEVEALKNAAPVPATDPALQGAVEELRSRMASLEQAGGDGGQNDALDGRLKALEATVSDLGQREGADPAAIAALSEKMTALESAAQAAGEAGASAGQKLSALEQTVAALSARVDAQAAQPKIAMAIASAALKSAIERGMPFTAEIETFAAISPNAPELEGLRKLATAGVPTRAAIEAEVDTVAAAMIDAGRPVDPNAGYFDRLISSAQSLVTIRPIGAVEGSGVPEIAARMEAAVRAGDYERALIEYATLPEASKAAGADFAAKLRARLEAEKLVDQAVAGAMQAG